MNEIKPTIGKAYFNLENLIYSHKKDLPLEQKAAMLWGALFIASETGYWSSEETKAIFGKTMAEIMKLF